MAKFNCNFISYSLMRAVDITVIIPTPTYPDLLGKGTPSEGRPRHTPQEKYPVLYLLHGIGNNHTAWTAYTNVELYAEERNIAVVMFSAENKCYADQPAGDNFFQFLADELPDFVCGMFPVSRRIEDTYIAGLSMGGYGTLLHILTNPERYTAAGAFSAATHIGASDVFKGSGESHTEQYDLRALAAAAVKAGRKLPALYISCGEEDFLFQRNIEYREYLTELGIPFTWDQEPGYGHEWRFWNSQIEKFLDQLPRTDYYAGKKRKC